MDALKLRHAKLRDNMDMEQAPVKADKKSRRRLNERSGEITISETEIFNKHFGGYEPCEEDAAENSSSSESKGKRLDRATRQLEALDRMMKKYGN